MPIRIAMAALIRGSFVLLAHRHPARRWYPDCWDLVGGHIESDETPEQAIRRECREELGVTLTDLQSRPIGSSDPTLEVYGFVVTGWQGAPANRAPDEHDALAWYPAQALTTLRLADPLMAPWVTEVLEHHRTWGV